MDAVIVSEELKSLRRCVMRVRDKTPASLDGLTEYPDAQKVTRSCFTHPTMTAPNTVQGS